MSDIQVIKLNEAYVKIQCESGIAMELSEYFTFEVPGAKFTPQYKAKVWDGKLRLFNLKTRQIYSGLIDKIEEFAKHYEYSVDIDAKCALEDEISLVEFQEFIKKLDIHNDGKPISPRDYQEKSILHCLRRRRALVLSPTASGKSLSIYMLSTYHASKGRHGLLIVPNLNLVHQMVSDFENYASNIHLNISKFCHKIFAGQDKTIKRPLTVSTWQSLYEMDETYFEQFDYVIIDEAHGVKANSLTSILTKMTNCAYRYGFTGTLDDTKTHLLVIQGLLGRIFVAATTAELIEKKQLADLTIKCLTFYHGEQASKEAKDWTYQEEIEWLFANERRNNFISNLAASLPGNTLILFNYIEKHGDIIHQMLQQKASGRVHYINGGVDAEDREVIRKYLNTCQNDILLASFGVFQTGGNIVNLHNVIMAAPSKSKIRNLQSLGRGLRRGENKESVTLFDLSDDLRYKEHINHTLFHFSERMRIYNNENLEYKRYRIDLET